MKTLIKIIFILMVSLTSAYAAEVSYAYDELNRLVKVIYDDGSTIEYTYDAVGNRVTVTESTTSSKNHSEEDVVLQDAS